MMEKLCTLILMWLFCWMLGGVTYRVGYNQGQTAALVWARCVADPACHATNDSDK